MFFCGDYIVKLSNNFYKLAVYFTGQTFLSFIKNAEFLK